MSDYVVVKVEPVDGPELGRAPTIEEAIQIGRERAGERLLLPNLPERSWDSRREARPGTRLGMG